MPSSTSSLSLQADMTSTSSTSSIQSMPVDVDSSTAVSHRAAFTWNKALPYDVTAHQTAFLNEIKENLSIAVACGDFSRGVLHWTRRLNVWVSL
ncbi:hypothetical protein HDU76_004767 [Blyttiomyces sp. JEL0837]|nr:hypothetical protein HDU76_004767 [Blyttiomyces sp. JEL0837]